MTKGRKEEQKEEYEKQAMRTEARPEAGRCERIMTRQSDTKVASSNPEMASAKSRRSDESKRGGAGGHRSHEER